MSKQSLRRMTIHRWMIVITLLICSREGISQEDSSRTTPMFFAMQEEFGQASETQALDTWEGRDSTMHHPLELHLNPEGQPLFFSSKIITPVCIDGSCKQLYIDIYWNLLGSYVGFGVYKEELLTKFDHELFVEPDYEQLHRLLLDRNSVLARKKLSDLFDDNAQAKEKVTFKGVEVDAVSGATKKEIKESVVEGALYSCYTLWHLVHGEVRKRMLEKLQGMYSTKLAGYFLASAYQEYQFYAIQQMDSMQLQYFVPRILEICREARPLTRTYLLKKLPKALWTHQQLAEGMYGMFGELDVNTRTLLIDYLAFTDPHMAGTLSNQIEHMTKNQLKAYLKALFSRDMPLEPEILQDLRSIVESGTYTYSYLIVSFLEDR